MSAYLTINWQSAHNGGSARAISTTLIWVDDVLAGHILIVWHTFFVSLPYFISKSTILGANWATSVMHSSASGCGIILQTPSVFFKDELKTIVFDEIKSN